MEIKDDIVHGAFSCRNTNVHEAMHQIILLKMKIFAQLILINAVTFSTTLPINEYKVLGII